MMHGQNHIKYIYIYIYIYRFYNSSWNLTKYAHKMRFLNTTFLNVFQKTLPVAYAYVPSMAYELNTSQELLWNHSDRENG